jgi:hypothetical protein
MPHAGPSRVVLAFLLAAAAASGAEPLNEDWLQKDRGLLKVWGDNLSPHDLSPDAFLARLAIEGQAGRSTRDLGLGLIRISLRRGGGYCSCRADLLVYDGRIARLEAGCAAPRDAWARLRDDAATAWRSRGRDVERAGHRGREYGWGDGERTASVRRALAAELGEPVPASAPAHLAWAVDLLTSPFAGTHVNLTGGCYYGGEDPEGKRAIDALVKAGRWDLVRLAARGPSPEGRVYAARALLGRPPANLTDDDRQVLERIRALPVPIEVCSGCLVSREPAARIQDRSAR